MTSTASANHGARIVGLVTLSNDPKMAPAVIKMARTADSTSHSRRGEWAKLFEAA